MWGAVLMEPTEIADRIFHIRQELYDALNSHADPQAVAEDTLGVLEALENEIVEANAS